MQLYCLNIHPHSVRFLVGVECKLVFFIIIVFQVILQPCVRVCRYAVDFAGSSLPGHPVDTACARLVGAPAGDTLARLAAAASVAYNASGTSKCLPFAQGSQFEQFLPGLIDGAWAYQRCTEVRDCVCMYLHDLWYKSTE